MVRFRQLSIQASWNRWQRLSTFSLIIPSLLANAIAICGGAVSQSAAAATVKKATTTVSTVKTKNSKTTTKKTVRLRIDVPCRAWVPKNVQPIAVLLCVHGLGLNSDSYKDFGEQMQAAGYGVFAVDVRGFGTWIKLKGKEKCDFDACLSDVDKALNILHEAYPNKPVFVLGESMGGAIAMRVAAAHQDSIAGLISSVPSGSRFHTTKNKVNVALHLVTLRGNQPLDVGTKVVDEATNDDAIRAKWEADPFDRLKLSSKELFQFQKFMNENNETAKKIDRLPVMFLVGLNDKLVKPKGTVKLYNEVPNSDKELITIRSSEHLIFELHKISPELQKVLIGWIQSHSKTSQPPPAPRTP
jgi:acylglycerol lipase